MKREGDKPKVPIIRMRKVPFVDSTGAHNLESLIKLSNKDNIQILLSGVNQKVHLVLEKTGIETLIGKMNFCSNIHQAVDRTSELLV
jgi:SulP family sulfate permease